MALIGDVGAEPWRRLKGFQPLRLVVSFCHPGIADTTSGPSTTQLPLATAFLCPPPSTYLPSAAFRPPLHVRNSKELCTANRQALQAALPPWCRCTAAAGWQAAEDPSEPLDSGWGSGTGGYCCWTRRSSLSPKSPSWNVSPACHVCARAVPTSCQSAHVQTSE